MKLGIMQPYFVPYIGYWQLMNAVDTYVIYDDVNFIKGGWINRNRILLNGEAKYWNLPMQGASPFKQIREIGVPPATQWAAHNLAQLDSAYRKAPYYKQVRSLLDEVMNCDERTLSGFIARSFALLGEYLGITTKLLLSSDLQKDCTLRGQDKVLAICQELGADEYYNAIGGQALYSREAFAEKGVQLRFLCTDEIEYPQLGAPFVSNLSIVDVMMFNPQSEVRQMLERFTLV